MPGKFALDFGTTNTVVARWNEAANAPETLRLEGLSAPLDHSTSVAVIPSLLYVRDALAAAEGRDDALLVGHQVRAAGYNIKSDPRFFSAFKRPLVAEIQGLTRTIDDRPVDFPDAARLFVSSVLARLAAQKFAPDELVMTLPVDSFERYGQWLEGLAEALPIQSLRIIDESTAAALGYDVAASEALVMVFDFGGGTLDVSIVRLGRLSTDDLGTTIKDRRGKLRPGKSSTRDGSTTGLTPSASTARVVAKSAMTLGGEDIDHWIVEDILARHDSSLAEARGIYNQLKATAEEVKIRLSRETAAEFSVFDPDAIRTYAHTYSRAELEELLDRRGFFRRIQECLRKALRQAEATGITEDSIQHVLMVGGTSLIPSVQRAVGQNFESDKLRPHKPFEAVAHGALKVAVGTRVEDQLYHSYGIRHHNPITRRREYEPFLTAGTKYPLDKPIEQILAAAHPNQAAIELVIGEITEDTTIREVVIDEGRIITSDRTNTVRKVVALNDREGSRTVAVLDPPGIPGVERVRVTFNIDAKRTLRITVDDMQTRRRLLDDVRVIELR